jgi:hypothetical protein
VLKHQAKKNRTKAEKMLMARAANRRHDLYRERQIDFRTARRYMRTCCREFRIFHIAGITSTDEAQ